MIRRFVSSLLSKKKALDALLDSYAVPDRAEHQQHSDPDFTTQTGKDYAGRGGTEPEHGLDVVIPSADLHQNPDPATAEFFKESDPKFPEYVVTSSGTRRWAGTMAPNNSPEWQQIQDFLVKHSYNWSGRTSDGMEMWGKKNQRLVYDPASRTWQHQTGGVTDLEGAVEELEAKLTTPKTSAEICKGCGHPKFECTCEGCQCPENKSAADERVKTPTGDTPTHSDDYETCIACDEVFMVDPRLKSDRCSECRRKEKTGAANVLYHVTRTEKIPDIKEEGITPLNPSNWVKGEDGKRYGEGEIFAFENLNDAVRWAAKMDWDFHKQMGTRKISIIMFAPTKDQKWVRDTNDSISQLGAKGKWLKLIGSVKPEQIQKSMPVTHEMVKAVVQGKDAEFDEEDVNEKTVVDVASSEDDEYEDDGSEAEDARVAAAMNEEYRMSEVRASKIARVIDSAPIGASFSKMASIDDTGWWSKSARPTPQKIELLQKQFKLTPEQIELCIAVDPSPNQTDFVAWIAKFLAKGGIILPEDTEKIKNQLEKFQKLKKSPAFTFSKDIQQYDPAKLFETLEQVGDEALSEKEKKREQVRKGAQILVQEGDVTVYKVTEEKAAKELGSGTNWCTAWPSGNYAKTYLAKGPLYIFFDSGSAVAQLHCEDNMFMNRLDVNILESVTGESSSRFNNNVKKFLADPGLAKALQLLAAKDPNVAEWAKENIADAEDVKKILGEAAANEIRDNTEYDQRLVQYQKDLAEYNEKQKAYQPKEKAWEKRYDAYHRKLKEWQAQDPRKRWTSTSANPVPFWLDRERPKAPERPPPPTQPRDPSRDFGYGSYGYRNEPQHRGKNFTMQVRHALATGQVLPPEIEAQLLDGGVKTDLLLKYGALFHPGQPWEPLAGAILRDVQAGKTSKKEITDYAVKFLKGRWPEAEPLFLDKLFLLTQNMVNMQRALEYATRVVKGRWLEFEVKIQRAKPGPAAGYGAAEYAINAVKQPWHQLSGIKRKKNGRINAEECMIKGNPGEARKYAEAFFQGKRWEEFEKSALEANNLAALVNYAADTLHARMPELEEKILSGAKDAQESKGRRRYRQYTDLPLDYAKKVIKGRWPEYEAKFLGHIKTPKEGKGYGSDKYEPSTRRNQSWDRSNKFPVKATNYIEQVVGGRWTELEQILLTRYQEHPEAWVSNQNLVDGYLSTLNVVCEQRYKDNRLPDEGSDTTNLVNQPMGTNEERDNRKQRPYTRFTQDQQCYWAEGEKRLVTRDPGFEKILLDELRARAVSDDSNWKADPETKYVTPEALAKIPKAPEGTNYTYDQQKTRPSFTIWNGLWIGWYGMDKMENYVRYFLANGVEWPEGVDVMELMEDLEDARSGSRYSFSPRHNWKRLREPAEAAPETAPAETAQQEEQPQMAFSSSLLKRQGSSLLKRKRALVEMHETPTMLPPRDDMKRHLDQQEQLALTDDVREGINPNVLKPHVNMIDPRINPDGVVASKTADYGDDEFMQEQGDEYFLDQVQGAEDEAKRHFMQESYLQQEADERVPPITMEELWEKMGDEYTAEFYGYPYKRVEDFTDQPTEGWEGNRLSSEKCPFCKSANLKHIDDDAKGYNSGVVLAECQNCRGFYSLLSH